MKKYIKEKQFYQYSKEDYSFRLFINVLFVMILYRIIREGILPFVKNQISVLELFLPLLFISACVLLCYGGYYIGEHFIAKKLYKKEECIIDGMILGLLLPIRTPIWLLVIIIFLTIFIGRYFYTNILLGMPVLIGILGAIGLSVWLRICHLETTAVNNLLLEFIEGYQLRNLSMADIWLGNIGNFVSKTSPILCVFGFFYLRKNIKWRIPVYYIGTSLLLLILSNYFIDNSWNDILKWLGSGNLLFLALFCATDKRTTPVTNTGQMLFAIFLSITTYIGSFFFPLFLSMILAILLSNFLTQLFDYFGNYYELKYCNEYKNI